MQEQNLSIKLWAENDRPREKLMLQGRAALSDAELIAILIGSGSRNETAVELSKRILNDSNNNLNELGKLSIDQLQQFKGIGEAKAITIAAALELGRRRAATSQEAKPKITSSKSAFLHLLPKLEDLPHEEFWVILLSRSNSILQTVNISKGGVSGTVADAKIIFKTALSYQASGIILAHNHPSGNLRPSEEDKRLTRKLAEGARLLDFTILDHIIIGDNNYFSFADENLL